MAKNTATIYELMVAAQNNDSKAMLTLIKKFRPILVKYSMMLNYEDSYDDLQVFLIQKIMTIDIDTIVNHEFKRVHKLMEDKAFPFNDVKMKEYISKYYQIKKEQDEIY